MDGNKSNLAVRAAVMNCLARCSDSDAPLCCLGEFLGKLADMGWNENDVQTVQDSVLRMLGRPLPPQHSDASDATLAAG